MARMIPAQCHAFTTSPAEQKLFHTLQHEPETAEWVVLHSLGLSRRGRKPYGEIDFVILIPGCGVVCLEVKGGRIACTDGHWETTDRNGMTHVLTRSPFIQAREGMFALRDAVLSRAPVGFPPGILFCYAVVTPDVRFRERSPEWESWQVIDRDALEKPIVHALMRLVSEQRKLHRTVIHGEPSAATLRTLQQLLRPDFEHVVTRGTHIEDTEVQLQKFTEEQFQALDLLTDNERSLFEGAAGTGKTMMALEYAYRSAAAGKRTLLVCYNRLLGDWFVRRASECSERENLTAGSFYKVLRDVIVHSSNGKDFLEQEAHGDRKELYESIYPLFALLAVEELAQPYDVLVMDEAQDLLSPGALDVLSAWLKNGLRGGCWAIFGDFHRQSIFGSLTGEQLKAFLCERTAHFARGRLTMNCRNTRNIGEETALLSGFASPPYRMGQVAGLPVDYHYYDSMRKQRQVLTDILLKLLADGVRASDIMILSRLRFANSCAIGLEGGNSFRIAEVGDRASRDSDVPIIRFATAQAFKGMESSVIVMCDVEQVSDGEPQALLYVAMSRARSHLIMLVHSKAQSAIALCVRRRLQQAWSGIS